MKNKEYQLLEKSFFNDIENDKLGQAFSKMLSECINVEIEYNKKNYKSLLDVFYDLNKINELEKKLNLSLLQFESSDDEYIKKSKEEIYGGRTFFYLDSNSNLKTIIYLNCKSINDNLLHRQIREDSMSLAVLYHELGHVNDIENEINIEYKSKFLVNTEEAELHAHKFACKYLMKNKYRLSLSYYINSLIKTQLENPVTSVVAAAKVFSNINEFKVYKDFLSYCKNQN